MVGGVFGEGVCVGSGMCGGQVCVAHKGSCGGCTADDRESNGGTLRVTNETEMRGGTQDASVSLFGISEMWQRFLYGNIDFRNLT